MRNYILYLPKSHLNTISTSSGKTGFSGDKLAWLLFSSPFFHLPNFLALQIIPHSLLFLLPRWDMKLTGKKSVAHIFGTLVLRGTVDLYLGGVCVNHISERLHKYSHVNWCQCSYCALDLVLLWCQGFLLYPLNILRHSDTGTRVTKRIHQPGLKDSVSFLPILTGWESQRNSENGDSRAWIRDWKMWFRGLVLSSKRKSPCLVICSIF